MNRVQALTFLVCFALTVLVLTQAKFDPAPSYPGPTNDRDNDGWVNTQDWKPDCPTHYPPEPGEYNYIGRTKCDLDNSETKPVKDAIQRGTE